MELLIKIIIILFAVSIILMLLEGLVSWHYGNASIESIIVTRITTYVVVITATLSIITTTVSMCGTIWNVW